MRIDFTRQPSEPTPPKLRDSTGAIKTDQIHGGAIIEQVPVIGSGIPSVQIAKSLL
jgi:hypothetical protein